MAFYDNFLKLCKERGVYPSNVALEIGLTTASPTYWKRGAIPKSSTVQKLADYFGVTVDYLLGGEDGEKKGDIISLFDGTKGSHTEHINDDDLMFALFGGADEITPEMLEEVRRYAAYIRQRAIEKKKKEPPQD